jgi:hypothetical protein
MFRPVDEVNGFVTEDTFTNAAGILPWLQDALATLLPGLYLRSIAQ